MKFYIIGHDNNNNTSWVHCDDDGKATEFATEEEALAEAKEYIPSMVVRAVASVRETKRVKVEKIK